MAYTEGTLIWRWSGVEGSCIAGRKNFNEPAGSDFLLCEISSELSFGLEVEVAVGKVFRLRQFAREQHRVRIGN